MFTKGGKIFVIFNVTYARLKVTSGQFVTIVTGKRNTVYMCIYIHTCVFILYIINLKKYFIKIQHVSK